MYWLWQIKSYFRSSPLLLTGQLKQCKSFSSCVIFFQTKYVKQSRWLRRLETWFLNSRIQKLQNDKECSYYCDFCSHHGKGHCEGTLSQKLIWHSFFKYCNKSLFMDAKFWILCNIHASWNIIFLKLSSTIWKYKSQSSFMGHKKRGSVSHLTIGL